jgi:hypothetical protein
VRAQEESAEVAVVKMPGETRAEQRAKVTEQGEIAEPLRKLRRVDIRNRQGVTTTVASLRGCEERAGGILRRAECAGIKSGCGRGEDHDERYK